jgi:hypothetical protein
MYYITFVFQMAGLSGNNLLVSSSIQYVINVVMTIPGLLLVDRVGRRPLMQVYWVHTERTLVQEESAATLLRRPLKSPEPLPKPLLLAHTYLSHLTHLLGVLYVSSSYLS